MSDSSFNKLSILDHVLIMMKKTLLIYKIGSNPQKSKTLIKFQLRITKNYEQIY